MLFNVYDGFKQVSAFDYPLFAITDDLFKLGYDSVEYIRKVNNKECFLICRNSSKKQELLFFVDKTFRKEVGDDNLSSEISLEELLVIEHALRAIEVYNV